MFARSLRTLVMMPLLVSLFFTGCANAEAPTQAVVESVMKGIWEHPASVSQARTSLQINSTKFGAAHKATARQVLDGIPEGGTVTPALVDFTVRTYHSNTTQVQRRVREAAVYKDKFGEWAVMTGQAKGQDQSTNEPAVK